MKEQRARYLFLFSLVFLSYLAGTLTGAFELPPYKFVSASLRQVSDFRLYWKNDLEIEPTRHLVRGQKSRVPWDMVEPERMSDGLRLIASVTPNHAALHGVRLFDKGGRELHYWPVDYERINPQGISPFNISLHGVAVYANGSIVVTTGNGNMLIKIDACGETEWALSGRFHHLIHTSQDGSLWVWQGRPDLAADHWLVQIDSASGNILRKISLIEDVILANNQMGIFGQLRNDEPSPSVYRPDPFHANDVEILEPDLADAFPMFAAGDIMISLRTPNLVAVLDRDSLKVKWWQHGPWHRQHDPDFQPDGTITIFDNRLDLGQSQIIKIDPATHEWSRLFIGSEQVPFYTRMRGQHQILANGNLLLTPTNSGRALEVTAAGDRVWEYQNIFDQSRNGTLKMAMLLAEDFFLPQALKCPLPSRPQPAEGGAAQ